MRRVTKLVLIAACLAGVARAQDGSRPLPLSAAAVLRSLEGARVIGFRGWRPAERPKPPFADPAGAIAPCPSHPCPNHDPEPCPPEPPLPPDYPPAPSRPPVPSGPSEPQSPAWPPLPPTPTTPPPPPSEPPRTDNLGYVVRVYRDVLGREPEAAGRDLFVQRLDWGLPRGEVVRQVLRSEEAAGRFVEDAYRRLLNRGPDEAGRRAAVLAILDGAGRLEIDRRVLASDEYFRRAGGDATRYVESVYRDVLARPLDPTGNETWPRLLAWGGARASVVEAIQRSGEAREKCVAQLYRQFIRSDPPAEAVSRLAPVAGGPGFSIEETIIAILTTPDYEGAAR